MSSFQEEILFEVLRCLDQTPAVSQRALARDLGISLGSINFCFKALAEQGLIKMQRFSQSKNKLRYAYLLTAAGLTEKSKLTAKFLRRKDADYEVLQAEIEGLKAEMHSMKIDSQ